jgi:hypothetical protein
MWPFKKKQIGPSLRPDRPLFKITTGAAFFEAQCQFGHTEVKVGKGVTALVLDAAKIFGAPDSVSVLPNGNQLALVKVASDQGGFVVQTMVGGNGAPLRPGDLVIWVPIGFDKNFAEKASRSGAESGWIGVIRAKIEPDEGPDMGANYKIVCEYPVPGP